jgi:hypothetical protein
MDDKNERNKGNIWTKKRERIRNNREEKGGMKKKI